ncbi:MAG: branched-chain amino acid ABC transporter permease [Actinomycetia bacterium]|nr:branched-chain amino acid ABC transporter permease [Actinomycetes bacterium]
MSETGTSTRLPVGGSLGSLGVRLWPLLAPAGLTILISLLALMGSEVLERKATFMLINMVFVLGLYTFVGNSGVLSFGHATFMALGAYTFAFMTANVRVKNTTLPDAPGFLRDADIATWQAVALAAIVPAVFALIVALPLMRLNGLAAGIATLAMLFAVGVIVSQWQSLTGGNTAFAAIRRETDLYYALVIVVVLMPLVYLYQQSRFGLRLRGTREDLLASRSLGINTVRERTIAWVISAAIVGIAGAMYAGFNGTIDPSQFFLGARSAGGVTFLTIAMLVVGGISSLAGAVVGTIFLSGIAEALREVEKATDQRHITEVVLALILLLTLILRPRGITGGREIYWPFRREQTMRRPAAAPSAAGTSE